MYNPVHSYNFYAHRELVLKAIQRALEAEKQKKRKNK